MKYALYQTNGRITSTLSCREEDLPHNIDCNKAAGAIETDVLNTADYFAADGELIRKSAKPSSIHEFDYNTKTWIDPRSLDEVRAQRWSAIKAQRDQAQLEIVVTRYGAVNAGAEARAAVSRLAASVASVSIADPGYQVQFTLANDSYVMLDANGLVEVDAAMFLAEQAIRARANTLRLRIQQAQGPAEIERVRWE